MKNKSNLLEELANKLWPINRSLTGDGVRETHRILSEIVPLETHEYPSGSECLDWIVPEEWGVDEAFVISPSGEKLFDFQKNNLRLVGYSIPFEGELSLGKLKEHLHSIPDMPDTIPYVTSYYKKAWGFCVTEKEKQALKDGVYKVIIKSRLFQGSMTISDCVLPGESKKEILLHTYTCHPSLAINELSGPLVAIELLRRLSQLANRRYTYRVVFAPETVGTVAYLDTHGEHFKKNLIAGFICTCVGHKGKFTYKKSRMGDCIADRAVLNTFEAVDSHELDVVPFSPFGSDERQYCSLGFNLPVGSLMRTPYHQYPEYHTSDDNLSLMDIDALYETVDAYMKVFDVIEKNDTYQSTITEGEPFFSKHGDLYYKKDHRFASDLTRAVKWLNHFSDGRTDLIELSIKSGISVPALEEAVRAMIDIGLLRKCETN